MAQQLRPHTHYSFRSPRNHVARGWEWMSGAQPPVTLALVYRYTVPIIRNKTNLKIFIYTYLRSDLHNVLYPDAKNFHSTILT